MFFRRYSKKIKQCVDEDMEIFDQLNSIDINIKNEISPQVYNYINQFEKIGYLKNILYYFWVFVWTILFVIIGYSLPDLINNSNDFYILFDPITSGLLIGLACNFLFLLLSIGLAFLLLKIRISRILVSLVAIGLLSLGIPLTVVLVSSVIPHLGFLGIAISNYIWVVRASFVASVYSMLFVIITLFVRRVLVRLEGILCPVATTVYVLINILDFMEEYRDDSALAISPLDDFGHSTRCPHITAKPVGFCSFG